MNKKVMFATTCAILMGSAGMSAAATVNTVINFDELGSSANVAEYLFEGYKMVSLNVQNSTQCATGKCIQENGQGFITTLTRQDNSAFNLDGFYFSLQGKGSSPNNVTVSTDGVNTFTYAAGDDDSNGATDGLLSIYEGGLLGNGTIQESNGANGPHYVVSYDMEFDNIKSVTWFASTTAKTRIDDIRVSREVPSEVPLPAAGFLLLAGLGALGMASRKKS